MGRPQVSIRISQESHSSELGRTAFCAARTTASAILALISRIRSRRGYTSPAARSSASSEPASATDACSTIESVTRFALASNAPRPRPGKIYILLPWPGSNVFSPREMGLYGEPEAKITLPLVLYAQLNQPCLRTDSGEKVKYQLMASS